MVVVCVYSLVLLSVEISVGVGNLVVLVNHVVWCDKSRVGGGLRCCVPPELQALNETRIDSPRYSLLLHSFLYVLVHVSPLSSLLFLFARFLCRVLIRSLRAYLP